MLYYNICCVGHWPMHFIDHMQVQHGPVQENSSVFKVSATNEARVVPLDSLVAVLDCQDSHLTMFTSVIIGLYIYFSAMHVLEC